MAMQQYPRDAPFYTLDLSDNVRKLPERLRADTEVQIRPAPAHHPHLATFY
jgi:hypothetical protein